ncbi:hypothetical protein ACWDSJ_17725 [Nocardia sp. NPDC003482]
MSAWIRQGHRWAAVAFVVTIVVAVVGAAVGAQWALYLPLAPLAVLAVSGLVMFVRGWGRAVSPVRRIHRAAVVVFVVTVLATVVALAQEEPIVWVSYLPLFPLAVLLVSGAYMFLRTSRRPAAVAG